MKANDSAIALKRDKVKLKDILEHIQETFIDALSIKNIELVIENSLSDEIEILIDRSAFRYQILNNILLNAVKFSPNDSRIIVEIAVIEDLLQLKIIDNGIGIPEHIIQSIFDPSKGTSRQGTNGEKGTGFGMPIVKTLIEGMEGSISIESITKTQENKKSGTTMILSAPLVQK